MTLSPPPFLLGLIGRLGRCESYERASELSSCRPAGAEARELVVHELPRGVRARRVRKSGHTGTGDITLGTASEKVENQARRGNRDTGIRSCFSQSFLIFSASQLHDALPETAASNSGGAAAGGGSSS